MRNTRLWDGVCQRCGKPSLVHTMSKFNTDLICEACVDEERRHPDYDKAAQAEIEAIKRGDYNFPGIGWSKPPPEKGDVADIFGGGA